MAPRFVFFGTGEFAVPILEALAQSEWRPRVVITAPDHPAGRHLKPKPSPVKQRALELGLEVWEPARLKDARGRGVGRHERAPEQKGSTWAARIEDLKSELIIVAAYGLIIPESILVSTRSGSINVHPSLLPRWRGPAPIQYTLLTGDTEAGVTVFLMDEEMDRGPVLAQKSLPVAADDTTGGLEKKLGALGALLLLETLPQWLTGTIAPVPQDSAKATYSKLIKKEDGLVDWSLTAEEIARRVRAFTPWPGSYTFWKRDRQALRLKILRALPRADMLIYRNIDIPSFAPGAVFSQDKKLLVATSAGALEIIELQPAGKKPMNAQQFLNGHKDVIGIKFDKQ